MQTYKQIMKDLLKAILVIVLVLGIAIGVCTSVMKLFIWLLALNAIVGWTFLLLVTFFTTATVIYFAQSEYGD